MTRTLVPLLQKLRQVTLLRYLVASVGALAVDMGSFLALLSAHVPAMAASAVGYALGIAAHWVLSSRKVFADLVAPEGIERTRQKAMFVMSAMIGLAITTAIVGGASAAGFDPRLAKLVAITASFTATWLLRKRIVFR
ncbi:GtrA family protein [Novosphingobium lentum]|uniref:GtrA family protein n=1 Tax=Novosphingobium lentum TaxID=145287 RepID=UPI000831D0EF|nr:GtrA family protein [Novosphingobium lentum]